MRLGFASSLVGLSLLLARSALALSVGLHPTPGARDSAGLSLGVAYSRDFGDTPSKNWQVPFVEGVLRKNIGFGQLELRGTASSASVGLNIAGTPSDSTVAVMLEPSVGVGYLHYSSDSTAYLPGSGDVSYTSRGSMLQFTPAITLLVSFADQFYLAPRFGFAWNRITSSTSSPGLSIPSDSKTIKSVVTGLSAGMIYEVKPFAITFEATVMRDSSTESKGPSPDWIFMPSVGVQLVGG